MLKIAADHSGSCRAAKSLPVSPFAIEIGGIRVQPGSQPAGGSPLGRWCPAAIWLALCGVAGWRQSRAERAHRLVKTTVCLPHYLQQTFGVHSLSPYRVAPFSLAVAIKQLPKQSSPFLAVWQHLHSSLRVAKNGNRTRTPTSIRTRTR